MEGAAAWAGGWDAGFQRERGAEGGGGGWKRCPRPGQRSSAAEQLMQPELDKAPRALLAEGKHYTQFASRQGFLQPGNISRSNEIRKR